MVLCLSQQNMAALGKPHLTYDGNIFTTTIGPQRVHMLNAQQYIEVENLAYDNIKVYDPAGLGCRQLFNSARPEGKKKRSAAVI